MRQGPAPAGVIGRGAQAPLHSLTQSNVLLLDLHHVHAHHSKVAAGLSSPEDCMHCGCPSVYAFQSTLSAWPNAIPIAIPGMAISYQG